MPDIEQTRMDQRPKGCIVKVLTFDEAALVAKLNAIVPEDGYGADCTYVEAKAERLAYGLGEDGKHYTIGTEGVGWEFDPKPLQVEFTRTVWTDGKGERHGNMGGGAIVEFTPEEAHAIVAASTETVDLAEFIRVFGDRLDVNHSIWYSRLQKGA